jgi:4-carboxymuconolactone decarboxylase
MAEDSSDRFQVGRDMMRKVYAGDIVDLPEGTIPFNDVMLRSLFAEVWARDVLDIGARRLLVMGVIAAAGQVDTFKIQARAALRNRELTPDQLREVLITLAPYAGYPNVAPLIGPCEEVIATWRADGEPGPAEDG